MRRRTSKPRAARRPRRRSSRDDRPIAAQLGRGSAATGASITRPSRYFSLGFLTVGGFIAGIVFWGGFNTALELTNTETFCIGCHEMRDNVYQELQTTIHYTNRSGVRAKCPDCHVPHNWTDKIARKMQASKEVWGKIFGTINTREKFEAHRLELASTSGRGSRPTTRSNAATATASTSWTSPARARAPRNSTRRYLANGERTCIDCHKGISHKLPAMAEK